MKVYLIAISWALSEIDIINQSFWIITAHYADYRDYHDYHGYDCCEVSVRNICKARIHLESNDPVNFHLISILSRQKTHLWMAFRTIN